MTVYAVCTLRDEQRRTYPLGKSKIAWYQRAESKTNPDLWPSALVEPSPVSEPSTLVHSWKMRQRSKNAYVTTSTKSFSHLKQRTVILVALSACCLLFIGTSAREGKSRCVSRCSRTICRALKKLELPPKRLFARKKHGDGYLHMVVLVMFVRATYLSNPSLHDSILHSTSRQSQLRLDHRYLCCKSLLIT